VRQNAGCSVTETEREKRPVVSRQTDIDNEPAVHMVINVTA